MNKQLIYLTFLIVFVSVIGCKVEQPHTSSAQDNSLRVDLDSIQGTYQIPKSRGIYRGAQHRLSDLIHTKLEVSFDWDMQRLNGLAILQLQPYFYPQDKLILDAKNFDIHEVSIIHGTEKESLKYYYDNSHLHISLDSTYTRESFYFVEIKYTAKPTEREMGGSNAIESDQGLYFINHNGANPHKPRQIWTQGETEANSYWFPTIDSPNERTTQEIFITVDNKYKTLSNGALIYSKFNIDSTRTDYWKMDLPHAPYLFMLAVGDFAEYKDEWRGLPVNYYAEQNYGPYLKDIFGSTPEMMTFFSELFDVPYPWPKYSQVIVRDFVSGAMENTTASVFYEEMLVDSRDLVDYHYENIIAHELMHQWFGDLVTVESWANLTLNEGFANYAEYLWNEYKHGLYEADLHNLEELEQYLAESETKQEDLIRFDYNDKEDMFDSHSYAKGGRVLHMLRGYIGDEAFFKSLKLYLEKHMFSSVEVHDLRLAFEEITGEDLNWFFNQWFLASGHPVLDVTDNYSEGILSLRVRQRQDLSTTPIYKLPLYVDVWVNDDKERFHVVIDKIDQVFEFNIESPPQLVLFDGDQSLLAEIFHPKGLEEYLFQYLHTDKFLAKYESIDTLINYPSDSIFDLVVTASLENDFWYFRQIGVNALEDYSGEKKEIMREKLISMARSDDNSNVRADALNILMDDNFESLKSLFIEALNDTSYMVAGTALYALGEIDNEEIRKVAEKFEPVNNVNVVIPLANFYINEGGYDKYDWFTDKIYRLNSEGLWYLLQYFGEYIMTANEKMQRDGILILEGFARNHKKDIVRLGAYQSLGLLSNLSGVDELRNDIRLNEKNDYLRELFESIP